MSAEAKTWHPLHRRAQLRMNVGLAATWGSVTVLSLLVSFPQTLGDAVWPVGTGFVTVLYAAMAVATARARVEADHHELRIARGLRTQHFPWHAVTDLRNNAETPWATHMVVDLSDGSSADVPLPPDHQGLVDFWDTLRSG